MDLKEMIIEERDRMQTLFDPFNEQGAFLVMGDMELGLRDRCIVTRVMPQFNAKGEHTYNEFWLFHCAAGYHHDPDRYSHSMKVVNFWMEDDYMIDMVDERGRRFHLEMIMESTEPGMVATWKEWQAFKEENAEMFKKIDGPIFDWHVEVAESAN